MDGPPAQSLGVEPVGQYVVKQKPRNTTEPMITRSLIINVLMSAFVIILGTLWVFKREVCVFSFNLQSSLQITINNNIRTFFKKIFLQFI